VPGVLVPIVEGQSEVRSIGGLLRRMLVDLGVHDVHVARPFRVKRNQVVRNGELERAITQAVRSRAGATGVLILLDADEDCPAMLAQQLCERGAKTTSLPVRVVFAKTETEAWILAAVDSVQGQRGIQSDAEPPADPEEVRDAKKALSRRMDGSRGYVATDDQPALLSTLDLDLAARRSPSFAKLMRDVASLVT
jgi:Domain of unknown function (DUF4276)